jgi:hypothetical protein
MSDVHELTATVEPGGLVFTCTAESCGRRVVIDGGTGEFTVIDHGDRTALHRGVAGDVELSAAQVSRG